LGHSVVVIAYKVKKELYSARMDHMALPANNTIPAFYLCNCSPEGASTTDNRCRHLVAAYYSLIDPERLKAELAQLADL